MPQSLSEYEFHTATKWGTTRAKLSIRLDLFINKTLKDVKLTVSQRVKIAGQFLRDKVAANLSRPVRKIRTTRTVFKPDLQGGMSKVRQTTTRVDPASRSKPGEFPRADTTRLMKSIFHYHDPHTATSRIGTPLNYGFVLEYSLERSFLRRTLNEMRAKLLLIIRGGAV